MDSQPVKQLRDQPLFSSINTPTLTGNVNCGVIGTTPSAAARIAAAMACFDSCLDSLAMPDVVVKLLLPEVALAIALGDPAGIGAEVVLKALLHRPNLNHCWWVAAIGCSQLRPTLPAVNYLDPSQLEIVDEP